MNTNEVTTNVNKFLIIFRSAADNEHYRDVEKAFMTLQEYRRLAVEPPASYLEYVQQQIRLAMPQAAYEAVDGGL